MEGPRYIWRNLVSSGLERIDTVPGDEAGFIPMPEDKGRPRKAAGGRSFD